MRSECLEITDNCKILVHNFLAVHANVSNGYMLKVENLNGQINAFCERTGFKTKIRTTGDNTNEIFISGINQRQFSRIVSMAVKDFGAYIIFAGCIRKDPDQILEDLQFLRRLNGNGC